MFVKHVDITFGALTVKTRKRIKLCRNVFTFIANHFDYCIVSDKPIAMKISITTEEHFMPFTTRSFKYYR